MKNLKFFIVIIFFIAKLPFASLAQPNLNFVQVNNKLAQNISANNKSTSIEECTSLQFKYAQLLNTDVEELVNLKLYDFIEDWWATRYRYGGTSKRGVDCSSYTGQLIQNVFGISLPRTAHEQYAKCNRINRMDLQEGDLVFFNTRGGVSHVGVYLGNDYFTHSSSSSGVTISSLNDTYYAKKYIGGGRVDKSYNSSKSENILEEEEN
ncbi:MAG: NlpC/P60 family protein [Ferruginibacter sp.]|nr:hypothetical protein [Ferruginibacter sp.]